jgi:uncharacterized protein (DUF433 family)
MKPSGTNHIVLDDQGRAWIEGANVKVIEVVQEMKGWGWSAEEIHKQHPHLPLAKVHAALSYYYDHQAEFDAEIARQDQEYEALRAQSLNSPLRQKLRALGKIP